jgi:hypothetical protein
LLTGDGAEVAALVRPWALGGARGPWRLRHAAPLLDGEGVGMLAFAPAGGGEVRVRLDRRDEGKPCFVRTARFNVYYQGDVPTALRGAPLETLLREVVALVRQNEGAWQPGS